MSCLEPDDIVRYHAGVLSEEQATAVREGLQRCSEHRERHHRLQEIKDGLRLRAGEVDDAEFAREIMTLVRMGRARRYAQLSARIPWWRRSLNRLQSPLWIPVTAAATAAVVLMATDPTTSYDAKDGFQARSGLSGLSEAADRWVSVSLYRQTSDGYAPVEGRILADDALAFSYVNRRVSGYEHLAVFAVDESGGVFWYYPAHDGQGAPPESIPIEAGPDAVALPDQIRHRLPPGLLRVFAVFSKQALDADLIEAVVARDLAKAGSVRDVHRLSIPDTGGDSRLLVVDPSHERNE